MPSRSEPAKSSPLDFRCPSCNAPPGQRCYTRRDVMHQSRQDAVKQYEIDMRKLTDWNKACQK